MPCSSKIILNYVKIKKKKTQVKGEKKKITIYLDCHNRTQIIKILELIKKVILNIYISI